MKVSIRSQNGIPIALLEGEIDTYDGEGFVAALAELSEQKPQAVILDFTGVKYIASHGIAIVIKFVQDLRRTGGQARLIHINPAVRTVIDMVNMPSIVPIADSLDAALAQLAPAKK